MRHQAAPPPEELLPVEPQGRGGPLEKIAGAVRRVIYHSEETGYTVCTVAVPGQAGDVTVVGACAALWEGEDIIAEGRWVRHPQHGRQFQAERITCVVPATVEGIRRFLTSGLIRGIGDVMADRLVAAFGDQTLQVIDRDSGRLLEVEGIGPKRREMIRASWGEQKAVRDIMVFLQSNGVGTAHAMRIFRQYGSQAVAVVQKNPYRLCEEVWGIGFKTADRIAMNLGVPPQSEARACAAVTYLLQTQSEEGHCYTLRHELTAAAEALLGIDREIVDRAVTWQVETGALAQERDRLYLTGLYRAEKGVAEALSRLMRVEPSFPPIQAEKAVAWAEQRMRIAFAPRQAEALRTCLANKVSIITGGPGVGKTTIVRALVDIFQARRLRVCLAAPTGRAAKRMEEATGCEAKTIHRLLRFNPQTGGFEHDAVHPLGGDVFILDEASMMDLPLTHALLRALPGEAVLTLVGDVDQLPSVGPGNVLRDLIDSGMIPCTRLDTIFRQEARSWIVHNAHRVNRGESLELPPNGTDGDFFFLPTEEPDEVIRRMLELVTRRIPERFGFRPATDIQVLTPMRRNQLGSESLNQVLQSALNPRGPSLQRFGRTYREGDRVLQIRNNYDKGVFNGDIGLVRRIDETDQEVLVDFDGQAVRYDPTELDELQLAYACSVHKAQGSEYPAVVLLLSTQHYRLLQRNLLYTAMTRGRKLVCLVGSEKAVRIAIANNRVAERRTTLRERLLLAAR